MTGQRLLTWPPRGLFPARDGGPSQLVGQLHITVPQHGGDREVHLLAKTHAGSATERTPWRPPLPKRGWRNGQRSSGLTFQQGARSTLVAWSGFVEAGR